MQVHYTDQLGNVRLSYLNNGSGAEVLEENNYYPFGLKHEGYNALAGNPAYQYKYNEKELQQETGWLDYGWRQYMPEIGKWNGMDQLSEKYYSTSPFAYVANNPISSFDVDGRWFNDDGSIDTSGTANGFVRDRSFMSQDFGQRPGEGGGGMTIGQLLDAIQGKSNPGDVDFSQFDFTTSLGQKPGEGGGGPGNPLMVALGILGIDSNAPANLYTFSIMTSLFASKDAWIAIANKDTMEEWSKGYIKFNVASDGLFMDPADPTKRVKAITNPNTGKIILAPGLFNGVRKNFGLGDVIIHENNHFKNWKNNILQGNHPLVSDLNEISAYIEAGQWTGGVDPGVDNYSIPIGNFFINIINPIK